MTEWNKIRVSDLGRSAIGKTPKTAVAENMGDQYLFSSTETYEAGVYHGLTN